MIKPFPDISFKVKTLDQLYSVLPESELIITDVLRELIHAVSDGYCKEKISFQVPYFYHHKGIAIVWPSAIPRGGIKEGVLFGIWYGNRMSHLYDYLTKGENKQIFYRVIQSVEDIDEKKIKKILREAIEIDKNWKKSPRL